MSQGLTFGFKQLEIVDFVLPSLLFMLFFAEKVAKKSIVSAFLMAILLLPLSARLGEQARSAKKTVNTVCE